MHSLFLVSFSPCLHLPPHTASPISLSYLFLPHLFLSAGAAAAHNGGTGNEGKAAAARSRAKSRRGAWSGAWRRTTAAAAIAWGHSGTVPMLQRGEAVAAAVVGWR